MDAAKFIVEKNRMCDSYNSYNENVCEDCSISSYNNGFEISCSEFIRNYPEDAVRIVEEWSKANPLKTNFMHYAEVMKEEFGIEVFEEYAIKKCPPKSHGKKFCNIEYCEECKKWWNEEYKAPKENEE